MFRLSRIRGKVAYATKAEHDFQRPEDFDPRGYANRIPWQLGEAREHGRDLGLRPDRLARGAQLRPLRRAEPTPTTAASVFRTPYAIARLVLAWAIGYEQHARVLGPPELAEELHRRLDRVVELHRGEPFVDRRRRPPAARPRRASARPPPRQREATGIRPERFARLVTLASVLIQAGRAGRRLDVRRRSASSCRSRPRSCARTSRCSTSSTSAAAPTCSTPRCCPNGEIEVDPEPYSDTFDRPARLLPIEARALLAAIELLGVHLSEHLLTARDKLERALGDIAKEGLLVSNARTDDTIARAGRRGDRGRAA